MVDEAADVLAELLADAEAELGRPLEDDEAESIADEFLAGLDEDEVEEAEIAECGGEGGKPGPCPEPGGDGHAIGKQMGSKKLQGKPATAKPPVAKLAPPVAKFAPEGSKPEFYIDAKGEGGKVAVAKVAKVVSARKEAIAKYAKPMKASGVKMKQAASLARDKVPLIRPGTAKQIQSKAIAGVTKINPRVGHNLGEMATRMASRTPQVARGSNYTFGRSAGRHGRR